MLVLNKEEKMVAMKKWLSDMEVSSYCINSDLTVNVMGDVDLSQRKIESFPLKFKHIKGNFNCEGNSLFTLKGAPEKVDGDFDCSHNKLKSLKHSPQFVGGNYYCTHNFLKNLKGAPNKILNGSFNCSLNYLQTLKGSPVEIFDSFIFAENRIKNLKYFPLKTGGHIVGNGNFLTSLKGLNENARGVLVFSYNRLEKIGVNIDYCISFKVSHNHLKHFKDFPKHIKNAFFINKNDISFDELKNLDTTVCGEVKSDFGDDEDFWQSVKIAKCEGERKIIEENLTSKNDDILLQKRRL